MSFPAPDVPFPQRAPLLEQGAVIGNHRLLYPLGEGGMGVVWLAVPATHPGPAVALKLPSAGSQSSAGRFERECALLARLDHPGIARLLEAGRTDGGWPYLTMEFVEGVAIDAWCHTHALPLRERLVLFLQVLSAVQHAHANLILHRDLKPSNILVTDEGQVKLLDFGIAKVIEGPTDDAADATLTQQLGRMLTPVYAAPEVLSPDAVLGTASDVYALGVVLYELLTGRLPYQLERGSRAEIEEAIWRQDPLPPSESLARHPPPGVDAGTLRKQVRFLRGAVDWIVLTALRKQASRRYPTAETFALDVSNHLAGLPIAAQRDRLGQRVRKFVHRHAFGLSVAGVATLALTGGAAVAAWQAVQAHQAAAQAQRNFDRARQVTTRLLFDVYRDIEWVHGAEKARAKIVTEAQRHLDAMLSEQPGNAALQNELAQAYLTLAHVQSHTADFPASDVVGNYRRAARLTAQLLDQGGSEVDAEAYKIVQTAWRQLGNFQLSVNELAQATQSFEKSQAWLERQATHPVLAGDPGYLLRRFHHHANWASLLMLDRAQAQRAWEEILVAERVLQQQANGLAGTNELLFLEADVQQIQADWFTEFGTLPQRPREVAARLNRTVELLRRIPNNDILVNTRACAASLQMAEVWRQSGDRARARAALGQVQAILSGLPNGQPQNHGLLVAGADWATQSARLALEEGQLDKAQPLIRQAETWLSASEEKASSQTLARAQLRYVQGLALLKGCPRAGCLLGLNVLRDAQDQLVWMKGHQAIDRRTATLLQDVQAALHAAERTH